MAGAVVAGLLDPVGVVAAALDDSRVAAVPAAGVEVPVLGDVCRELGQECCGLVRGKKPGLRPGG